MADVIDNPCQMLCVRHAYKYFDKKKSLPILNDLNMTVPKGTIYGLLGPSGCGKTTMLNCLIGQLKLNSGQIHMSPATVGYMPQGIGLYKEFTIREIMKYFGWIAGMNTKDINSKVKYLAKLLVIPDVDVKINSLSGGQQRRVSFATTLLHDPNLLVLDEPTVGLDPILKEIIWNHLVYLAKTQKVTVIITSHYLEETRQAHVIGLMREGYIVAEESPQMLLNEFGTDSLDEVFLKLSLIQSNTEERFTFGRVQDRIEMMPRAGLHFTNSDGNRVHHLKAVMWKNLLFMVRNLPLMATIIALPAVLMMLFGVSFGHDPFDLNVAVVNYETNSTECGVLNCQSTDLSCHYLKNLEKKWLNLIWCDKEDKAKELVLKGQAYAAVFIRQNYSAVLKARVHGVFRNLTDEYFSMDVVYDGSEVIIINHIKKVIYEAFQDLKNRYLVSCNESTHMLSVPIRWNPHVYGVDDIDLTNPGLVLTLIFTFSSAMSACSLLIEQNEGILERSLIMGVKNFELLISHTICDTIVITCQVLLILLFDFVFYGVVAQGSLYLVFTLCFLTGLCGMCFGFALSITLNNETAAIHVLAGLGTPLVLLTGVIWPIEAMHRVLKVFTSVFPITVASESMKSILQRGWDLSFSQVYVGFAYMLITGFVFLTYTVICLQHRKSC